MNKYENVILGAVQDVRQRILGNRARGYYCPTKHAEIIDWATDLACCRAATGVRFLGKDAISQRVYEIFTQRYPKFWATFTD